MSIYNLEIKEVLVELGSRAEGLSAAEVRQRRIEFGWNKVTVKGEPLWRKLIEPFLNIMILLLVVAAGISLYQGEVIDSVIILATIMLNAAIDWVQTWSTERVLKKLRETDKQKVAVRRGGKTVHIDVAELVVGDIIHIGEGEKVPADARMMDGDGVTIDESVLTGESLPVTKTSEKIKGALEVYDQKNMLFAGSFVTRGSLTAVVTQTGNHTQFGNLAQLAAMGGGEASPVQKKIDKLVRQMILATFIISTIAFILALLRGIEFAEALRFILALAVSAVPEGLPVAITVILVLGMQRMAKQKALIRNMRAIEDIGEVTVIATDKTGTLTKNQISVQDFWNQKNRDQVSFKREIALSINDAKAKTVDPLDIALNSFVAGNGPKTKSVQTVPFNYQTSVSGNVWQLGSGKYYLYVKGAPEKIIARSRLTRAQHKKVLSELHQMTRRGERVIGFAKVKLPSHIKSQSSEQILELIQKGRRHRFDLIGLVGMADTLRSTAAHAVDLAEHAGIDVKMITGDHAETALSIAKELNIAGDKDAIFDATKLATQAVAPADVRRATVFARVVPETKFKILEMLKSSEITAMTGDGVNDVPALTKANVGVAMGSGSQIAKDAGDIVLLNDNFKSIVDCIRESRVILENIKRMLVYLIATNVGEILVSLGALLVGLPLPLTAVQILWINLITDTLLVIPIGLEPGHAEIMKRKPNNPKAPILSRQSIGLMVLLAGMTAGMTLGVYSYFLHSDGAEYARTMAFVTLIFVQIIIAWTVRSMHTSVFKYRVHNPKFLLAVVVSLVFQGLIMFTALGESMFKLVDIRLPELGIVLVSTMIITLALTELYKVLTRGRES
ncbi:MAG: cation-transporting P-type ATPase [Candidatus Nomurabacteria bacterium]|jgi:Ca2+-transporting ATPase|nr:cation-transporting P-type ATPase [Candidatus Nomurabacteria bacterium]